MKISRNSPWGIWRGRYAYDSSAPFPLPAGVFTMRLDRVSFEKRYRTRWVATAEGTRPLREWLAQVGFPTETPLPGQRVFYEGRLEDGGTIARGTWRLLHDPTLIRSKQEDHVVPAGEASGTWIMKRIQGEGDEVDDRLNASS